jgi:hypothetical protein
MEAADKLDEETRTRTIGARHRPHMRTDRPTNGRPWCIALSKNHIKPIRSSSQARRLTHIKACILSQHRETSTAPSPQSLSTCTPSKRKRRPATMKHREGLRIHQKKNNHPTMSTRTPEIDHQYRRISCSGEAKKDCQWRNRVYKTY